MSAVETSAIREYVVPLSHLTIDDVAAVGGKNASLGEMIGALTEVGVRVPGGFATTADAYREFLRQDRLDARITKALATLDVEDLGAAIDGQADPRLDPTHAVPASARSRRARRTRAHGPRARGPTHTAC